MGPKHLAAALTLHLDAVTAEVVEGFRAAGVRAILLRGPAVGSWLYRDEGVRTYVDVDLFVQEGTAGKAASCLQELGFADVSVEGVLPGDRPTHARTWSRAGGALVDLHTTILGLRASGDIAWAMLTADTDTVAVAGAEVEILAEPARALMLALHAAQHGARFAPPLEDLGRAIALVPPATWEGAATLAARLGATDAFAAGLRLLPAGAGLAERLGLPADSAAEVALRASTPPPMALGFEWLSRAPGWRNRGALIARKVFPTARFMRAWSPLAARGPLGLVLAYAWRPLWLLWHTPKALKAWGAVRGKARS